MISLKICRFSHYLADKNQGRFPDFWGPPLKKHTPWHGGGQKGELTLDYNGDIFMSSFPNIIHGHHGLIYKRPGVPKRSFDYEREENHIANNS